MCPRENLIRVEMANRNNVRLRVNLNECGLLAEERRSDLVAI